MAMLKNQMVYNRSAFRSAFEARQKCFHFFMGCHWYCFRMSPPNLFCRQGTLSRIQFGGAHFQTSPASKQGVKETYLERNSPGGIIAKEDSILEKESMLRDVRLSGCNSQSSPKVQKSHFQQFLDDPKNDWERWCLHAAALPRALKASSRKPPAQGNSWETTLTFEWHFGGVCLRPREGSTFSLYCHCIFLNDSDVLGIQCVYYIWFWGNYNDLTATSVESWLIRGIIPTWPYFRLVKYYNLPRYYIDHFGIYTRVHPSNPRLDFFQRCAQKKERDCPSQTKVIATW